MLTGVEPRLCGCGLPRNPISGTSRSGHSPKFASLSTPNNQLSSHSEVVKILQLSDAPSTPLWCHGGRRYIKHKVEALNPALWKLGTQEGLGSQWCNRLPSIPQEVGGERGCGRYVLYASYLTDPPLKSSTYLRTR